MTTIVQPSIHATLPKAAARPGTAPQGTLLRRMGAALRARLAHWAERRRQAIEEDKLWEAAVADARQMADISRAMDAASLRDPRYY